MKLLFENWRKFINEADSNMREFVFSESELSDLNRSIAKIVAAAKASLGAHGPSPLLSAKNLEKIKQDLKGEVSKTRPKIINDTCQNINNYNIGKVNISLF